MKNAKSLMHKRSRFWSLTAIFAILAYIILRDLWDHGLNVLRWENAIISGWILLLVGVSFARQLPEKINTTLRCLVNRGILDTTEDGLLLLKKQLTQRRIILSYCFGGLVGTSMLIVSLVIVNAHSFSFPSFAIVTIETIGGYLGGFYFGYIVCYASLGWMLQGNGITWHIQPGHPDRVAGLRPLGAFYFFQTTIAGIVVAYLALWSVIIPACGRLGYVWMQKPYLSMLFLSIGAVILLFLSSMFPFHKSMRAQKKSWLQEMDRIDPKLASLHQQLSTAQDTESLLKQTFVLGLRYRQLESIPTWPIHKSIRQRFLYACLAASLCFLFGLSSFWLFEPPLFTLSPPPPPPPMRTAEDLEGQLSPPDFGAKLPVDYDWTIATLNGQEFSMTELQGKVGFLNFWATWCAPCVAEMPSIQRLYEQFKDRDVVFVCVSREDPETVRKFVEKHEYNFPIYTLDGERPEDFMSRGIPATFILDRDGYIAFRQFGSVKWDDRRSIDFINKLLELEEGLTQARYEKQEY